jgi:hypothetical protein
MSFVFPCLRLSPSKYTPFGTARPGILAFAQVPRMIPETIWEARVIAIHIAAS